MSKVKIVYWSGTGNTERMAEIIDSNIKEADKESEIITVEKVNREELLKDDVIVMGCPSMGNEELEESEMEPFVADIEGNLSGKKVALFGSYGWGSGEWMESWEERMKKTGAEVIATSICNEAPTGDDEKKLKDFAEKIVALL